jgi:putative ABC transport system permease protein
MRGMVPVARRNILADRRRLTIATLGVGLAIALMLLLEGLWGGVLAGITAYPDRVGAALFVREPAAMALAGGAVPLATVDKVRGIPGADRADAVIDRFVILDLHGTKEPVSVVGFVPGGIGGPWRSTDGRSVRSDGEIAVDQSLAADHGLRVGQRFDLLGRPFRIVGLTSSTRTFTGGAYLFVSLGDAERMFGQSRTATFILVRTSDPASVGRAIADRTGLAVETPAAVAASERELYAGILGRVFNLMVLIAFAAGTLIVALTVYSAIADRLREYGIAKAMGAKGGRLFRIVAGQTLVLAALGTVAGFALYLGGSQLIAALSPQFPSVLTVGAAAGVVVAAVLMALLAAIVPTRRVARLDPASVYRGE